jgi:hypothetical protein
MTETLLTELITPNIKEVISTKIDFFIKNINLKYKEMLIPRGEHFEEYLLRAYEKYQNINTLVFHNSQRLLKDIYVPQTLVKENQFNGNIEIEKITEFPSKLVKKYKKLLITDTAGMGKSTIMKRMFIDVVDNCMKEIGIPIYIELNRLGKNYGILEEIKELLKSLSNDFDNDLLLRLIQSGGFIFFLDGYDEISISDKENVTNNIQDFISKAGINNYYIMTSRLDVSLASFGDFQSFKIAPLEKGEAFELLKKYDLSNKKELSSKLIELLNTGQYKTIDEYLQNPLLVSLLFTAYDYNRSIPFEKHRFYNVVFDAYFEKHDSSKPIKNRDKYSGLNYDSFDRVLRFVGFRCLLEIGVKFNKDTILNTIRQAKGFCGNIEFDESDFLKDLIKTVPLFCQEGTDYKWVHKSLLEYFAARFIFCDAKDKQDDILSAIYKSDNINKYTNLLDLYYSIDFNGFNKNIRYPFCREYISYYESIPSEELSISTELIEERKSNLFVNKYFAVKEQYRQEFILKFKEKNKGFEARETIIFKSGKCVIKFSSTLSVIEKLLCNHSKELFSSNTYSHNRYISSFPFVENIENSCFDEIDIKKCNEDDIIYENLNLIMNLSTDRQPRYYLNYNACKKVVEDFEQKLKDESAKSELLKGL